MSTLQQNASTMAFTGEVFAMTQCICATIGVVAVLIGCFGNGLIFLAAAENRAFKDKLSIIILSLSTADFVLCAFITPMCIYLLFARPPNPPIFCSVLQSVGSLCGLVSIMTLSAIAVHRVARIFFRVKSKLSTRQSLCIVLCIWLVSLATVSSGTAINFGVWTENDNNCLPILNSSDTRAYNFVLFFMGPVCAVSFILIIVSYTLIAFTVQSQCRSGSRTSSPTKVKKEDAMNRRLTTCVSLTPAVDKEIKAISMCIFVTLLALLCWGPLMAAQLVEVFAGPSDRLFQVKVVGTVLIFFNSAVNPFVYAQRRSRIRVQLREISKAVSHCCSRTRHVGNNDDKNKLRTVQLDGKRTALHCKGQTSQVPKPSCDFRRELGEPTPKTSMLNVPSTNLYASNILTVSPQNLNTLCSNQLDLKSKQTPACRLHSNCNVLCANLSSHKGISNPANTPSDFYVYRSKFTSRTPKDIGKDIEVSTHLMS